MTTDKDSASSSEYTLEPYSPALFSDRRKHRNQSKTRNDCVEILPGLFESTCFDKYLVLSLEYDLSFQDTDIFDMHRDIVKSIGREAIVSFQADGTLVIEAISPEESEKIKNLNKIQGYKVDCKCHQSMNSCHGVIFSKKLIKYSEEKLLQEFKDQHVTDVKRIKKKVDDELLPTPLLILTFDLHQLPPTISAAWMRIHIRPYIPSSRCFHCQKFGHFTTSCRNKLKGEPEICVNCGMHRHGECETEPCCANCGENHLSSSRNCTHYAREKEILTLKITDRISFREAKNKVKGTGRSEGVLFYLQSSEHEFIIRD